MKNKIDAFISYSHADPAVLARLVQDGIENLGKPWYQLSRNLTLYRDETSLSAGAGLWEHIETALANSAYLILLASKSAAGSSYVAAELDAWINMKGEEGGLEKIILILIDGEIKWDASNQDFDWSVTNAIPALLSGKFSSEPLWVDLRSHILSENGKVFLDNTWERRSIFAKIVGRLTDREPREIESSELRRKRVTRSVLAFGALFILMTGFLAYFMFRQKELEKAVSRSSALIAAGNALKDSDISRSLVYFAYAYRFNPIPANLDLLVTHYKSNVIISEEEYAEKIRLNCFFTKLKNADPLYEQVAEREISLGNFFLSVPAKRICRIENGKILIQNLSGKLLKTATIPFNVKDGAVGSSSSSKLYFLNQTRAEIVDFDMVRMEFSTLPLTAKIQLAAPELRQVYSDILANSDRCVVEISDEGKYLLIRPRFSTPDGDTKMVMVRLNDWQLFLISLAKPTDMEEGLFNDTKIVLSDDGNKLIRINHGSNNFSQDYLIYDVKNGRCAIDFFKANNWGEDMNNQPTVFRWIEGHRWLVYGTRGGRIAMAKSDSEEDNTEGENKYSDKVFSSPEQHISEITALASSKQLLVAGTAKGALNFYRNQGRENFSHVTHSSGFLNLANVRLPSVAPVEDLHMDTLRKILLVKMANGELYQVSTAAFISRLSKKPDVALRQLFLKLGVNDLSPAEKKKYNIGD